MESIQPFWNKVGSKHQKRSKWVSRKYVNPPKVSLPLNVYAYENLVVIVPADALA